MTAVSAQDTDREKECREEIAKYTQRLQEHPRDFAAWYNRALAHEQCREYDLAIDDYVGALNPRNDFSRLVGTKEEYRALAHHYLGRVFHWHKREYQKAVNNYTEALRLDPSIEMVHYRRGRAQYSLKQYEAAERDFAVALQRDPDYSNLLVSWAWQLGTCPDAKYRDGAKAVEFAIQGTKTFGMKKPGFLEILAAAYAERGDFDEAVAAQQKAISLLKKGTSKEIRTAMDQRLSLYKAEQPYRDADARSPID